MAFFWTFYVFGSSEWTVALHSAFWISIEVVTALFICYMAGATWNFCRLGASSMYTMQPCISLQCHFIRSHICKVYVYLAVTCHLHFQQNGRDLLRATDAVTRGWNGYRNTSQHRNLTLEKKIRPLLLPVLEPVTFRLRVRHSTTEQSPLAR